MHSNNQLGEHSMVARFLLAVTLLTIVSCSQQQSRRNDSASSLLAIDSVALASFRERIAAKYTDNSPASILRPVPADSMERALPSPFSPTSRIRLNKSCEDTLAITLYSFDKRDSCILYKGLTPMMNTEFDVGRAHLPTGNYILRVGCRTENQEKKFFFFR